MKSGSEAGGQRVKAGLLFKAVIALELPNLSDEPDTVDFVAGEAEQALKSKEEGAEELLNDCIGQHLQDLGVCESSLEASLLCEELYK